MIIFKDVSVFDGKKIQKNKTVIAEKNRIKDILPGKRNVASKMLTSAHIIEGQNNLLIPGFIDIQVNGGGGFFFNREPTEKSLQGIFNAHLKFGTTSILPTCISDSCETIQKCITAVENILKNKSQTPGVLGIHIEGPFINKEKRGIHCESKISNQLDLNFLNLLNAKIPHKLITLAPEIIPKDTIQDLIKKKCLVFAGHTNATEQVMKESFKNGIKGVTHLFNACSPLTSRDAGVVGTSLLTKDIWCGLIVDGKHVSYDTLRLAFKLKPSRDFLLISDAMESVGTDKSEFYLFDEKIYVREGMLTDKKGTLAGAHLTMLWAFQNLLREKLVSLEEAIQMSSTNQAKCLGLEKNKGAVLPEFDADLVLLDKNNFRLLQVIHGGNLIG